MLSAACGCRKRGEGWSLPTPPHLLPQYAVAPEPGFSSLFVMYVLQKSFRLFCIFSILLEKIW